MDTFAEKLEQKNDDEVGMGMFADDVKLQSKSCAGLQRGLDDGAEWACEKDMPWGTPKCHILEPEDTTAQGKYVLAGQQLEVVDSAEYLGVTLRGTKIVDDKNVARAEAAMNRIGMLRGAWINRRWVHSAKIARNLPNVRLPMPHGG